MRGGFRFCAASAAHDPSMRIPPTYDRTHPVPPGSRPTYWSLRPIWVVDNLDRLRGPSSGVVNPALQIQWSNRRRVHLDDRQ